MLRVRYCDHSLSIGVCRLSCPPSVLRSHFLFYTLSPTNINQSAPNLVKIYLTKRSGVSLIMGLIRLEHLKLFALELKKIAMFVFVYTLASTNIKESATRVLHGSLVKCLTRNPGVLGLSRTGSSGIFRGSVLGQDTSEPSLEVVKPRKDMNNMSCGSDMTEILLKVA